MSRYTIGSTLNVTVDDGRLQVLADEIGAIPEQIEKAMKAAINRTIQWMQTRARRAMMKSLNLPSKVIRARLRYALYHASTGRGRVWFGLDPISLARLGAKQTKRGVTARGEKYPGAFIATGRGGNKQVFKRVGKKRLPIESIYKEIDEAATIFEDEVFDGWEDFLYKRFEHELQWQTSKA